MSELAAQIRLIQLVLSGKPVHIVAPSRKRAEREFELMRKAAQNIAQNIESFKRA